MENRGAEDLASAAIHDPTERDLGQDPNILPDRRSIHCCGFAALASVKSISVRYVCLRRMLELPCCAAASPLSALTTDYSAFNNVQLSTPKPCATRYRLSMEMFCSDRSTALR